MTPCLGQKGTKQRGLLQRLSTWHNQTETCFWNPFSVSEAFPAKEAAKFSPEWPFSKLIKLAGLDHTSSGRTGLIAADTEKWMKGANDLPSNQRGGREIGKTTKALIYPLPHLPGTETRKKLRCEFVLKNNNKWKKKFNFRVQIEMIEMYCSNI